MIATPTSPDAAPTTATAPGPVVGTAALDRRLATARHDLSAGLVELERRLGEVKHRLDPRSWIANPWTRLAVAAGVGFVLGRSRAMRPVLRAAVTAAVTTVVREAFARPAP